MSSQRGGSPHSSDHRAMVSTTTQGCPQRATAPWPRASKLSRSCVVGAGSSPADAAPPLHRLNPFSPLAVRHGTREGTRPATGTAGRPPPGPAGRTPLRRPGLCALVARPGTQAPSKPSHPGHLFPRVKCVMTTLGSAACLGRKEILIFRCCLLKGSRDRRRPPRSARCPPENAEARAPRRLAGRVNPEASSHRLVRRPHDQTRALNAVCPSPEAAAPNIRGLK